jgi:hypothetical protein
MVFLDGSHEYEDVFEDITLWRKVLKQGGLLCGHDYQEGGGSFPGVARAVLELVPDFKLGPNRIWYSTNAN